MILTNNSDEATSYNLINNNINKNTIFTVFMFIYYISNCTKTSPISRILSVDLSLIRKHWIISEK